jgi:hypothetical protein
MNQSASLLNDTARTVYTYAAQIPYLKMALQELREEFEQNSVPVTENSSAVITVLAGQTVLSYNAVLPLPALPSDMVEPLALWERTTGIDPYVPMTKRDFLPHNLAGTITGQFVFYVWQSQQILVLPANQNNDIKIDYIKQLFTDLIDENSQINVINAQSFLEYRTAGLVAEFVERNLTTSDRMNQYALLAMNRVTGIASKGKQNIMTRRRPFRAGYKGRGWIG